MNFKNYNILLLTLFYSSTVYTVSLYIYIKVCVCVCVYLSASGLSYSTWDISLWCTDFSLVMAAGSRMCGLCSLKHAGSLVEVPRLIGVAHMLSCCSAYGIIVP